MIDARPPIPAPTVLAYGSRSAAKRVSKMPFRIPEVLLDTTIYLYPDEVSAEAGQHIGGSGFIAGVPLKDSTFHTLWAVTNKHIIDDGYLTIRLNKKDGGIVCIDTIEDEWHVHPDGDDLAIRPLAVPHIAKFNFVPLDMMLTQSAARALDIGPGDEAFVIGRFVSREGTQKNAPTVRFGRIAQSADEQVKYDSYLQMAWLVEIMSLNGFSGSPVFCALDSYYSRNVENQSKSKGTLDPFFEGKNFNYNIPLLSHGNFPTGPFLLGIDCCMIRLWSKVCDASRREMSHGHQVELNTGMMGVIPSWRLVDLLENNSARAEVEASAVLEAQARGEASASGGA